MKLILASASPRRAEILRNAAIPFETQITLLDESILPGELPGDYVRRLALEKPGLPPKRAQIAAMISSLAPTPPSSPPTTSSASPNPTKTRAACSAS